MTGSELVLGAGGLVGAALMRAGAARGLGRADLDITRSDEVQRALDRWQPRVVLNAAAQARVDLAETEPEWTWAVNHRAVEHLARACRARGIRLLHLGTDYSLSSDLGLVPEMQPAPRGVYAESKSAGEQAALAEGAVVVRVQWVYHPDHAGFFGRCLRALRAGERLRLVDDQVGCPTAVHPLALALLGAARGGPVGLFHLACEGETTPLGWIGAAAEILGLPLRAEAITRAELGGAPRPARSVLDSRAFRAAFGVGLPHWREALAVALRSVNVLEGRTPP